MIGVTVKVDGAKKALDGFLWSLRQACEESLAETLRVATKYAQFKIKAQTKRRTGALYDGIVGDIMSPTRARLRFTAKHTIFMDQGTRPHIIRPRKAGGFLSWIDEGSGNRVFARAVRHPGTRPRPFVDPAAEAGRHTLQRDLQARVDKAAERMSK